MKAVLSHKSRRQLHGSSAFGCDPMRRHRSARITRQKQREEVTPSRGHWLWRSHGQIVVAQSRPPQMGTAEFVCLALPTPTIEQETVTRSRLVLGISSTASDAKPPLKPYTADSLSADRACLTARQSRAGTEAKLKSFAADVGCRPLATRCSCNASLLLAPSLRLTLRLFRISCLGLDGLLFLFFSLGP